MSSGRSIATNLVKARMAWGLSREQVALRAGVPVAKVRAAERNGRVEASMLAHLVGAMGGTLDDLFTGKHFWVAPALALKTAKHEVDSATLIQGLVQVSTAARDYHALARYLELPDLWAQRGAGLGPVNVEGDELRQAETLARQVRKELGSPFAPLASVRATMARFGVATFLTQFASDEVDGAMWRAPGEPPCVVVNVRARGGLVTAARMTFAHELCHALFDRPRSESDGRVDIRGPRSSLQEKRANAFAAYLLAPREGVRSFLQDAGLVPHEQPTQQHLLSLSLHFGMGVEAMAHHLVSCGFWSEETMLRNRVPRPTGFTSMDDKEMRPTPAEALVPIERRGALLDLATLALVRSRITVGRWRELLKLGASTDWRIILEERHIELDAEYYLNVSA